MIAMDNKLKWREQFETEREYFFAPPEPFKNWERNSKPEWIAERYFVNALEVLYASVERELPRIFLSATVELLDRAFDEDRFHAQYAEYGLPKNIGEALRVRTYTKALMGEPLAVDDLKQGSEHYIEWCSGWKGADWDSQAQSDYLTAVRIALIAGDLNYAKELLATKRKFKWHAEEHQLLLEIAHEAEEGIPINNLDLRDRVDRFFDLIRDPDFKPDVFFPTDMGRFEWGVLVYKYFVGRNRIDWPAVINLISR